MQPITLAQLALQFLTASTLLVNQTTAVVHYAGSLPPKVEVSEIMCHDAKWENEHLKIVDNYPVRSQLAPYLAQLLTNARSQGLPLSVSSGYRNCAQQLQLRGQACGLGSFNLYQKLSEQCRPPTEPPGKSMHQEGLAVDFICQNYSNFGSSPCFEWLKGHAGSAHLSNYSLEPWHWSTTGR